MYWKHQRKTDYLIRMSKKNAQKSLGPRSPDTEAMYEKFTANKAAVESRLAHLSTELVRHQRMNRALFVGRAPEMLVAILQLLARVNIAEHFLVVGTHALFAYETAAGVRFEDGALATRDIDLLWDTRRRLSFASEMKMLDSSLLGLLKKVDPTFRLRADAKHTAVNDEGFEIDILRREPVNGDPHPLRITEDEEDFWVVQARRAGVMLDSPTFSSMIVAPSGQMARLTTISPLTFVKFKRWMGAQADRDPLKAVRDRLQADLVKDLVKEYLPQVEAASDNPEVPPNK